MVAVGLVAAPAEAKWVAGYKPRERTWLTYGARYSRPQQASASITVMRAMESDTGLVTGWFLQAEPGLDGGKLSIGIGGFSASDHWALPPMFAIGVKASAMRTWGSPRGLTPRETLFGPEVDITIFYLKISAGVLVRVAGSSQQSRASFTWGIGAGF
jgi:hypothetical protein